MLALATDVILPMRFEGNRYDVTNVTRSGGDGLGLTVNAQAGFNIIGTL